MIRLLFHTLAFFTLLICSATSTAQQKGIWVHVDTDRQILTVFDGQVAKDVFNNIAIGQAGTTLRKQQGDDKTQLGSYRIAWINRKSRFRTFYGINYPSTEDANRALAEGRITKSTAKQIINAHQHHKTPSQYTRLGGMLGIHGLGRADPDIHERVNWTHGCIALTNEQIDRLGRWLRVGTVVLIQ
ncbi:MAG TPA: L,D-transpeptidase [Crenotrichaceae bacterium]|nr:L,D-transpeptidase [Crenotrichaceae bacterium]